LGLPGSKPRTNSAAVDAGIKIALALSCKMPEEIFFSRKSYFYPDMSKNFQITQYEVPIAKDGMLEVGGKTIRIRRLNLEEDPAKLVHIGGSITDAKYVLVDYNRSGTPLCEIVTEPDFDTPREARLFLQQLMMILEYLKVFASGEYSLKTDANISIQTDDVKGERVEVKNITGFREIEKALNFEIVRQRNVAKRGQKIGQETRAWDAVAKVTRSLRTKEGEDDYGYIPENDLTRIELKTEKIKSIEKSLPEMPQQKRERYQKLGLSKELAYSIAQDLEVAQMFENLAKKFEPKFVGTWMLILQKTLNYNDLLLKEAKLSESVFSKLLKSVESGKLSERAGELVLREIILAPEKLDELLKKYEKAGAGEIEKIVISVIAKNSKAVEDYKKGNEKSLDFILGQVMRETKGKADAKEIRNIVEGKIGK
ncbi:MAG: Asp-tRNA(Asn)/Glu-tRNA(Gln) amidotransferase subunit GatB, partial [Candidatus Aenigmatarchaeota archaeon]